MDNVHEYKCPCCGGAVEFNSSVQKIKCPYCDTEFEMEALASLDNGLDNAEENMEWSSAGSEWTESETDGLCSCVCKSCGGEIIGDKNTGATSCPYCGNPVVMMTQFTGGLKPDYVIPFKFDKNAAKEGLKKHLQGKKLLPSVFSDDNHIEEIKGIYVPFWFFDAKAGGNLRFKGLKTKRWEDQKFRYVETSYYGINRAGSLEFKNIPADGSSKMADDLMESIEPYNFGDAVDFQTAYLAGYLADKYDVTDAECTPRINERIRNSVEESFKATIKNYENVNLESGNVSLLDSSVKYVLCPVWLLNTEWNGEKYTFAMNGQTGKFVGNLPMDKSKYKKLLFATAGIASAVCLGISFIISLM